jgi:hypothetical protein
MTESILTYSIIIRMFRIMFYKFIIVNDAKVTQDKMRREVRDTSNTLRLRTVSIVSFI